MALTLTANQFKWSSYWLKRQTNKHVYAQCNSTKPIPAENRDMDFGELSSSHKKPLASSYKTQRKDGKQATHREAISSTMQQGLWRSHHLCHVTSLSGNVRLCLGLVYIWSLFYNKCNHLLVFLWHCQLKQLRKKGAHFIFCETDIKDLFKVGHHSRCYKSKKKGGVGAQLRYGSPRSEKTLHPEKTIITDHCGEKRVKYTVYCRDTRIAD